MNERNETGGAFRSCRGTFLSDLAHQEVNHRFRLWGCICGYRRWTVDDEPEPMHPCLQGPMMLVAIAAEAGKQASE